MATVSNLFVSPEKNSGRATPLERVRAIADHGFEGCAHARPGQARQVLFASKSHLDALDIEPGRIRENITVEGADVQQWQAGQRLRIGDALFEISMDCPPCERMDAIRPGLQAELQGKRGTLARVLEGGELGVGDAVELV